LYSSASDSSAPTDRDPLAEVISPSQQVAFEGQAARLVAGRDVTERVRMQTERVRMQEQPT
jgi:hypothetical protein